MAPKSTTAIMTLAPKRRWQRFTLRTLFVMVTVFCCCLGYELNWIRQRHELLARADVHAEEKYEYWIEVNQPPLDLPWPLRLMGETGYRSLTIVLPEPVVENRYGMPSTATLEEDPEWFTPAQRRDLENAIGLFPEAEVVAHLGPLQDWPN